VTHTALRRNAKRTQRPCRVLVAVHSNARSWATPTRTTKAGPVGLHNVILPVTLLELDPGDPPALTPGVEPRLEALGDLPDYAGEGTACAPACRRNATTPPSLSNRGT
jgi:hypothetical protein